MFCFAWLPNVFMGVWALLIIPKWLVLTPGHIAIRFGWFLELPKNQLNLDPRTPYLSPKYFKKYKKHYGDILDFSYLRIWKSEIIGRYACLFTFRYFENLKLFTLGFAIRKLKLDSLELQLAKLENLEIINLQLWNFVPLRCRKLDLTK